MAAEVKVYIVADARDAAEFKSLFPPIIREKEMLILNTPNNRHKIEGLRVKAVYFTPDVMTMGMDSTLFEILYRNFVSMGISPNKGFRLIS